MHEKSSSITRRAFVQRKGLEPSWYCYHTDLNRARLPIPPSLLDKYYYIPYTFPCQHKFTKFFKLLLQLLLFTPRHSRSLLQKALTPLRGSPLLCSSFVASARRNAHILGALDLHSCRQIFMRDRKSPTGMYA